MWAFFIAMPMLYGQGRAQAVVSAQYGEALHIIRENSLVQPALSGGEKKSLKQLLRAIDSFSDFLTPEEYAAFLQSQKGIYSGIGMEIEKKEGRGIICIPYSGSPAERAGVHFGDLLISVNGKSVAGKSLYTIAAMTMGKAGTIVKIEIRDHNGRKKVLHITRQRITAKSVSLQEVNGLHIIRIIRFVPNTRRELKFILDEISDYSPIIIDLRGNPGGDLNSAIDCAMIFLDKGEKIIEVRKKRDSMLYKSVTPAINLRNPIFIFQDEKTASAAEVFIAALCQNRKAVSIGRRTYGKGVVQDIFQLSDGSAIFLTTGQLIPPNGIQYHKRGLPPKYLVNGPGTKQYIAKVRKLAPAVPAAKTANATPRSPVKKHRNSNLIRNIRGQSGSDMPIKKAEEVYACLDRAFASQAEADRWSLALRKSAGIRQKPIVFQTYKSETIIYMLCYGPYAGASEAEKKRRLIAQKIEEKITIGSLEEQERNVAVRVQQSLQESHGTAVASSCKIFSRKTGQLELTLPNMKKSELLPGYYIEVGSFLSPYHAVHELKRIAAYNRFKHIYIDRNEIGEEPENVSWFSSIYSIFSNKGKDKEKVNWMYRILIGPFKDKDEGVVDYMKTGKLLSKDAKWIHIKADKDEDVCMYSLNVTFSHGEETSSQLFPCDIDSLKTSTTKTKKLDKTDIAKVKYSATSIHVNDLSTQPKKLPSSALHYYIQVGSYNSYQRALQELEQLNTYNIFSKSILVNISIPEKYSELRENIEQKFLQRGFKLLKSSLYKKPTEDKMVFRIVIGPYDYRDKHAMKRAKSIYQDAFWVLLWKHKNSIGIIIK